MKFFKNILRFFNTDHYISFDKHCRLLREESESSDKRVEEIIEFLFNEKRITKEQYSEMKNLWMTNEEFLTHGAFPYISNSHFPTKSKYADVKWNKRKMNLFTLKYLLSKGYISINTKEINKLKN